MGFLERYQKTKLEQRRLMELFTSDTTFLI
jgi:hypothetical protein